MSQINRWKKSVVLNVTLPFKFDRPTQISHQSQKDFMDDVLKVFRINVHFFIMPIQFTHISMVVHAHIINV